MNITFLSVNSSFSHTSMAYHLLKGYADPNNEHEWAMVECSINEKVERTLSDLLEHDTDWLLASNYIFNTIHLFEILRRYVLIRPNVRIILGGPEFLGNNEKMMRENPWIDLIVRGEGEIPLKKIFQGETPNRIRGVDFINEDGKYIHGGTADLADMEEVIPHYNKLFDERRPFVQYETSRGCPNRCSFCTSSLDPVLRFLPLDVVRDHLMHVKAQGIKEVRILDRTFNSKNSRAIDLIRMFREDFPEIRFHMEVDPAFVQEGFIEELKKAPEGQIHIETGLQTFSQETYDVVQRISPINNTVIGLETLCSIENIEIHADLIGGLPGATLQSQRDDLLRLIRLRPKEIQLENLKLLPGTPLCKFEELVAAPTAPYEVLKTDKMNYEELVQITEWSRMLDWFYNYFPLQDTFADGSAESDQFFIDFHLHLKAERAFDAPRSVEKRYQYLKTFLENVDRSDLMQVLVQAWFENGNSPEKTLFKAQLYTDTLPEGIESLSGEYDSDKMRRIYRYDFMDRSLFLCYGKGAIHNAELAILSLGAHAARMQCV